MFDCRDWVAITLGLVLCCAPGLSRAAPVAYRMVDLNLQSGISYSSAYGISGSGLVVGSFLTAQGQEHAYLFDGWSLHDLGTLGGDSSCAYAINGAGVIVGDSLTGATDASGWVQQAFRSDGFTMQPMGAEGGAARGVNSAGEAVGELRRPDGTVHAARFAGGDVVDLGALEGLNSSALAINDAGQVVGMADSRVPLTGQLATHGFRHDGAGMVDLGSLGYACWPDGIDGALDCFERSVATDINNAGQIAGHSTTAAGPTHAFLMTDGSMNDLGTLGGRQSWAKALNDSGQVVGAALIADDAAYHAFLFEDDRMYDLNELVTEPAEHPEIWGAEDINNFGQIVGVNFRLDPLYDSIDRQREFAASGQLGQRLSFEYWVAGNRSERCLDRRAKLSIQVRVEVAGLDRSERRALRRQLNRWLEVTPVREGCGDSLDWQRVSLELPEGLAGQGAEVRVRIRKRGQGWDPTVYLRRFQFD